MFIDFNDLLSARPVPTLLPLDVRRRLHTLGLDEVHQSGLSIARECPNKLHLQPRQERRTMSIHALCGSVFHLAFLRWHETQLRMADEGYWYDLFTEVRMQDPGTIYTFKGRVIEKRDIKILAHYFTTSELLGISLGQVVLLLHMEVMAKGVEILEGEKRLEYVDAQGQKFPVRFVGTLDLVCAWRGRLLIGDVKTSGLWDPYLAKLGGDLDETGSVKKQSYDPTQMLFHPQLRHYDWLYYKVTGRKPDAYGLLFPTNLIPYKTGKDVGKPRGEGFPTPVPAMSAKWAKAYEFDTIKLLTSLTSPHGDYRAMPTNFGKPTCPSCPYFSACLGDAEVAAQAVLLAGSEFDYLRE